MICFHSLIYWYFTQLSYDYLTLFLGCDLLSFFDLLIFHTAIDGNICTIYMLWFAFILWFIDISHSIFVVSSVGVALWFAFILWFIDISHSHITLSLKPLMVVICFHSLIYWYFTQPNRKEEAPKARCDLLSFFDLLIFHTAH